MKGLVTPHKRGPLGCLLEAGVQTKAKLAYTSGALPDEVVGPKWSWCLDFFCLAVVHFAPPEALARMGLSRAAAHAWNAQASHRCTRGGVWAETILKVGGGNLAS